MSTQEAMKVATFVMVNSNMADQVANVFPSPLPLHLPLGFVFQLPSYTAFNNSNIQTTVSVLKHSCMCACNRALLELLSFLAFFLVNNTATRNKRALTHTHTHTQYEQASYKLL